ncbi:hypothetical protein HYPSUDRAFT_36391 [Hypholoma sublateritium FD-334 SS-4]|uniref:Uncharacterized protein n=1 Tax=Hypholoma sublateritium (strain FD-334 SS-4) TaxID=945553 RepID=A0A0D2Q553_HYPSF|nr:hypothetical protein HYPSUDRAFT_36391 [Hypholoma sublateritium FD-334 SS-4]
MYTIPTFVAILFYASLITAQVNITVPDTDPSISYKGNTGDATLCKVTQNGTIIGGQEGCYLVPANCAPSVAMGQSNDSAASFSFEGSAIYINSLLSSDSPLYTVTLDGISADIDGYKSSNSFVCETLFSQTGLDPKVQHTITLATKGASPSNPGGISGGNGVLIFSLINFIYTSENSTFSTNSSTNTSSTAQPSPGTTSAGTSVHTSITAGGLPTNLVVLSVLLWATHWI